ncbi:MAG TPA: AI-2E family transporter [Pyrinomonadaceae bacterium]
MRDEKDVKEVAKTAATQATWLQTRTLMRVLLLIVAVWYAAKGALWVLYELQGVILLLVLSIFFAYLIAPLVEFVRRPFRVAGRERTVPRALAIGVVYLGIFGTIGLTIYLVLPRLYDQFPQFSRQAQTYVKGSTERLNSLYSHFPAPVAKRINEEIPRLFDTAGRFVQSGVESAVGWLGYLPWFVLIPILAFFLLKDVESFRASALQMLPRGRWRWRGDEFFQDVNSTLAAYIRAQLTACLIIGLICTIGFWAFGLPYPLVVGVIAGMLEFIPLVGPLLVALGAGVITSFQSAALAFGVLLFLGVLRIVWDYVVYPRIIGQGIHLHPLAVILAILCGAELAGVVGVFLAIPIIAILTVSYRHWLEHKGSEGLVADLLKPAEEVVEPAPPGAESLTSKPKHPTPETTPEQMARARPDLTTGELKLRKQD